MRLKRITQQVVVVVGASSGIGREVALRFAKKGARLVVCARSTHDLQTLVDEIRRGGGEVTAVTADVTDFEQLNAVADRAIEQYGRIDTWVHLASVGMWGTFEQTTPAEFRRIIDVNLTGQAYGAMVALPHLRREGQGALIHVSSVEAVLSLPLQSAYTASKHGMVGLLDALRLELQHEGVQISVTNVMPSSINTPFFDKARTTLGVKPRPLPPMYQPQIVADAILYAAENPTRDIVVGGAGKAAILTQRISPRLTDAFLRLTAFSLQRTSTPKSADAPHSLFQPVDGYDLVEGDFGGEARSWSLYTWMSMHPHLRRVVTGTAVSTLLLALVRKFRN